MRRTALAVLALLAAAPPALAQGGAEPELRIVLDPSAEPSAQGAGVAAELLEAGPQRVAWRLSAPGREALDAEVRVRGWFDVQRVEQVVPESLSRGVPDDGWHFFFRVADVRDRAEWARAVNATGTPADATLRLAFPLDAGGEAVLRLSRDVAPPNFTLGPPTNVTHFSFHVEARTDEHALADLRVRPAAGGEEVPNPTTVLALLQRFPVQGLDPETDYVYFVEFTDWAGNAARSPGAMVRTLPRPVLPAPTITAREPPPNATLAQPVALVAVNFTGPAPASVEGVAVFVDKLRHEGKLALREGRAEARLDPPLGPGFHSVGFELTAAEGGRAVEAWTFTVAGAAPAAPLAALASVLALAALARRRR